jgi:competence protein ComEC
VLAAVIYLSLRAFALPATVRICATLMLIWLYILVAGAPPSAIRAGVVATFVLGAGLIGRHISPLHFMTTMLAAVLTYNPLLVYNTGFQLSVAAVFGILLLRKPLKSLVEETVLRPFKRPGPNPNLLSVSLAAQIATAPRSRGELRRGLGDRGPDQPGGGAALGPDSHPGPPRLHIR